MCSSIYSIESNKDSIPVGCQLKIRFETTFPKGTIEMVGTWGTVFCGPCKIREVLDLGEPVDNWKARDSSNRGRSLSLRCKLPSNAPQLKFFVKDNPAD